MSLKNVLIEATERYGEERKDYSYYPQLPEFNGKRLPDWVRGLITEAYEQGKEDAKKNSLRSKIKKFTLPIDKTKPL